MRKYIELYRTILRTFGFKIRPIGTFALLQAHGVLNRSTLWLDGLLYPQLRTTPIDRPIFIVGNPRSGTTFLHRFLLETERLAAFELWEMLFPAITARRMLGPFVDRLAPLSPARYHSGDAHETGLRDVETDDALALFHFVDGAFVWSYFHAWQDTWGSQRALRVFDEAHEPHAHREKLFRYFEDCWRRNLLYKGKSRIVVKASTFSMRARSLLQRYPDCRLVYMVRDPVEVIPSAMSLLTGVLERSYDMFHCTRELDRRRYLENLYQAGVHMFRAFHDDYVAGAIPHDRLRVVRYSAMMADLSGTIDGLLSFLEIEPADAFRTALAVQSEKQRSHTSRHKYSLEKFGLTEDRIRSDLAFVYKTFDL
ncbi:MAG: sulfotransferase [Polyangiaceae bacterium]|nr:sulfotransferase [Polyangiaceae bacterium]